MNRLASALAVLLSGFPSWAAADAIAIPPSCPEGSTPFMCHGPTTCEILGCSGDGDCAGGMVCRPRDLCVREHCCAGMCCITPPPMFCMGEPTRKTHVEGSCSAGACSAMGTTCETRQVCVLPDGVDGGAPGMDGGGGDDAGTGGPTEGGCCSTTGPRSPLGGVLFLVGALFLVARRIRRGG